MAEYLPVYPHSVETAAAKGELEAWRTSHHTNVSCKRAVDEIIRQNFDGMHLRPGCVQKVCQRFGYVRTAFVLANTLQAKEYDGRFSPINRAWLSQIPVPAVDAHSYAFVVDSHPAVLDGFMREFRMCCQHMAYVPIEAEPAPGPDFPAHEQQTM